MSNLRAQMHTHFAEGAASVSTRESTPTASSLEEEALAAWPIPNVVNARSAEETGCASTEGAYPLILSMEQSICEHGKRRWQPRDCGGSTFREHDELALEVDL